MHANMVDIDLQYIYIYVLDDINDDNFCKRQFNVKQLNLRYPGIIFRREVFSFLTCH